MRTRGRLYYRAEGRPHVVRETELDDDGAGPVPPPTARRPMLCARCDGDGVVEEDDGVSPRTCPACAGRGWLVG